MLIALHKETSINQPSEALIRNLLATNLCVVFIAYWISILQGWWQTCQLLFYAQVIGAKISLFVSWYALTGKGVDRLLALLLGRRYRQIAMLSREYLVQS